MANSYTIDRGAGPVALPYGPFADGDGVQHPAQVLDAWTDDELEAIGVVRSTAPPSVPARVSSLQANQALLAAGLLDEVEAAVSAASSAVQIYWNKASHFHRDHPVLETMRVGLGWTNEALDALFIAAGEID